MGIISMKKNNIGYLLREGFKGVFLHGFMSFAAICVTVACLIIMGTFSLILYNLHVMILDLEQENEILVYIDENYSEAKAKSVGSQINLISNVHEAKFVSRQQALDEFIDTQNDAALFDGIKRNASNSGRSNDTGSEQGGNGQKLQLHFSILGFDLRGQNSQSGGIVGLRKQVLTGTYGHKFTRCRRSSAG